jgi:hypothetical protein
MCRTPHTGPVHVLRPCCEMLLLTLCLGSVLLRLQEDDSPSSICEQLPLSQLAFKVSICSSSSSSMWAVLLCYQSCQGSGITVYLMDPKRDCNAAAVLVTRPVQDARQHPQCCLCVLLLASESVQFVAGVGPRASAVADTCL